MKKKTNRRKFIAGITAFSGALPFSGFPAVVKMRNPNSLLSHACIGTGNMAKTDMLELIRCRDLHITAICDVDSTYLDAARKHCPDARIYRDAFEMLAAEDGKIDSVNVSTPDHSHAQYIIESLKRGLNVYAQKPLCHDLDECSLIAQLAAEKKAVTQMGTQIAAWQCDRRTAAAISSGVIGEIKHVWLFSNHRNSPKQSHFKWPVEPTPVPPTLEWKLWLGPAKFRPFAARQYHPRAWRKWREFGTSWLGDLGLHVMSPVWLGMKLGNISPVDVTAEISNEGLTEVNREQFWPLMSHVTWTMPGVKASGHKPFKVEWCDGFADAAYRIEPRFLPPAFLRDIASISPSGRCGLPKSGRAIEGSLGWIFSTHYDTEPFYVMKNGKSPPALPSVDTVPNHYREYVDACLGAGSTTSEFDMASALTRWGFLGNLAQLQPGKLLDCSKMKGLKA